MLDPTKKKKKTHVQGQRRTPNKTARGAKSCLESNPIPTRDAQRTQTKLCAHQNPETPQRLTKPDLPLRVLVSPVEARISSGLLQGQGSGCSRSGSCNMWHKLSWRMLPLAPPQSRQADDPQTEEQLYQRNSCTVKKVLGPTRDFPTWGSGKGTKNTPPHPREFDFGG